MTAWAAQALLGSTLVMLLLLGFRGTFVNFGGARAIYALWALVPLRFVLPPLPASVPDGPVAVSFQVIAGSAAPTQASPAVPWLLALWLAGAALFACLQLLAYQRFVRRALAGATPFGAVDGIPVLRTPAVTGPVALGPFRRRILVPTSFADQPAGERALALRHEALHHARGDLWANLLACALLALHWFNPIAHLAHRAFRRDQELACDAAVIGGADADTRHHYGRALARAAGALPPAPATTLGEARTLKRRLDMLKAHRARTSKADWIGAAALGAVALVGTATGVVAQTSGEPKVVVRTIKTTPAGETTVEQREGTAAQARADAEQEIAARCAGKTQDVVADAETGDGSRTDRTRIITCGVGGADKVTRLQDARARIANNAELSAEHRAKVLASLDAAIAQARAAQ